MLCSLLTIDWTSVLITLVTVAGGHGVYNIYKRYRDSKDIKLSYNHSEGKAFRKELLRRIDELEEREHENRQRIEELLQHNANLRAKVAYLSRS